MTKLESRTKNSTRNMIFSMLAYMTQIVLGFLVRRYFIYYFNAEYLGLNSLFTNVISLLSLAELGFGAAIVFAMYKPMADGDDEKVRQLLQFYKKCYLIIGLVVLAIGACVFPFVNFFKTKAPNVNVNLYIVYAVNLFNVVITYFFAHRRSLLYTSQRSDIESKINTVMNIVSAVTQLLVLVFIRNYYLYISIAGIVAVINNVFVYIVTQKMFPELLRKPDSYIDKESIKSINKNIRAMIFHKIGSAVVYGTDSLVIFLMLGSESLGKYSNYLLITTYVSAVIAVFTGAMRGSIGNSIASESVEKNHQLLKKLNFIYFWIISFCTISIFILADPFIDVILTKSTSDSLTFDKTIILLIAINFFLSQSRYLIGMFKECAGLFYQDRFKSLVEAIVNLVVSIVLAKYIGIAGVIVGTIASTITTSLWIEPYVFHKHYLKKSTIKYFGKYAIYALSMIVSGVATFLVCTFIPDGTIWLLLAKGIVCVIVSNVSLLICMGWLPEFKECFNWGKLIISRLLKKKKVLSNAVVQNNENDNIVISGIDVDKDGIIDTPSIEIDSNMLENIQNIPGKNDSEDQ